MSTLPEKVATQLKVRQRSLAKVFLPAREEEEEEEDDEKTEHALDEVIPVLSLSGKSNRLQSQLTTVEHFIYSTGLVATRYLDGSHEATAIQAMHLSAATATATYPMLVRPTHPSYISEPDIIVDLLRMQAGLPLNDADRAQAKCTKCQKDVDRRGYHAAFCSMTRIYAHDAFVRELRDFLRAAGVVVMLEPVHILPHLADAEQP